MNRIPIRTLLVLACATSLFCSGCFTLAGFGVGTVLDASAMDSVSLSPRDALSAHPGSSGILVCTNGQAEEVIVLEAAYQRDDAYWKRYASWCAERPATHSAIDTNATLSVWVDGQPVRSMHFVGFDMDGVWLRQSASGLSVYAAFAGITAIQDQALRTWGRADLELFVREEHAPVRSGLLVRPTRALLHGSPEGSFGPERFVSISDIVALRVEKSGDRGVLFALAGFGADIVASYVFNFPSKISH